MKKQFFICFLILALLLSGCAGRKADASLAAPPSTAAGDPTGTVTPEPSGTDATASTDPATDPVATGEPTASDPATSTEAPEPEPSQAPKPTDAPKPTEAPKPVHQHSYKAQTVAATCTSQGYTYEVCSCGAKTEAHDYTPALGHDYQATQTVEATPWASGYTESTCTRCGDISRTETGELTDAQLEAFRYEVAKATIKYINEYRRQEGSTELTYLPGLSQVAMYRSEQLISDFSHNMDDYDEAFAHFQYGRWKDLGNGDGYYCSGANEAIGGGIRYGTADTLGKLIADGLHNSPGHWRYVGSSEYSFAGAGWCVEGYCVVFVTAENYG